MLAKLRLMPEELQSRRFDTVSQLIARQLLANQGVMIIENAFAPEFIETARRDFMKRYESCLVDPFWSTSTQSGEPAWSRRFAPDGTEMLRVGHRRVMIPIGPSGLSTAGGPDLYANPFIMELIRELLGDDCLLGSFCVVVAFPGAEAQHIHRDHPLLFGDPSLDVAIPPYAINVMVPLVDLTVQTGPTRVWPTSHHVWSDTEASALPSEDVIAPSGSCCLMDYRLLHGGAKNRSAALRPLICMVYNRPWFRDSVNFAMIPEMRVDRKALEEVPAAYQSWFSAHARGAGCGARGDE